MALRGRIGPVRGRDSDACERLEGRFERSAGVWRQRGIRDMGVELCEAREPGRVRVLIMCDARGGEGRCGVVQGLGFGQRDRRGA